MTWIKCTDQLPHEVIEYYDLDNVLIAYHRVCDHCGENGKTLIIGIGYMIFGKWKLTEPLDVDVLPNNQENLIYVKFWQPMPELPPEE